MYSCKRKRGDSLPKELSAQREGSVQQFRDSPPLHGEKRGGLTAKEHAGGQPALQWP